VTDLLAAFFLTDNASSSFDHISFTSACFPALNEGWGGYVMDTAIFFGLAEIGGSGGHHSVTNCSFTGGYGMRVKGLTNGSLTVGGASGQGNVLDASGPPLHYLERWAGRRVGKVNSARSSRSRSVAFWRSRRPQIASTASQRDGDTVRGLGEVSGV
jgi:hypothetical protein